jgi:hypothetical protein
MIENRGKHLLVSPELQIRIGKHSPCLEETEEEPSDIKHLIVDRCSHQGCRGTPEDDEYSHKGSRRYSNDQIR